MSNYLQRLAARSNHAFRCTLAPTASRFASDTLLPEIPGEHLHTRVGISSPARTATEQGSGKFRRWKIGFLSTQKWENPLTGWTSTGDLYATVSDPVLTFDRDEAAKEFAERHSWNYMVRKLHTQHSSKLGRFFITHHTPLLTRPLCTSATEIRTQKLERIANELLSLNKLERHDYAILFRHKMGLNRYGPAVSGIGSSASGPSDSGSAAEAQTAEKTIFDVKLEKFDAAAKIKVIKEIRGFTDLGLKEAKDLVEKAPVVVKKGITKDEADLVIEKLKGAGASAVLE